MTNLGCNRFEEICTLVAAGAATPEEEQALQAHLAEGCSACTAAHHELREAAARLTETLPPIAPPPAVRARLLDAIEREGEVAPGSSAVRPSAQRRYTARLAWPWAAGWALAAAMGLILILDMDTQRKEAHRHASELETVRRVLTETEETLRLVQARQTQLARLAGLSPSPTAFGKVFWNPQANAGILIAFDLPPLAPGKVYQLWAIQGAAPVDAGIFLPDPKGTGALKIKPLPDPRKSVQLFAITIEPTGGSSQPTGEMYLRGTPVSF